MFCTVVDIAFISASKFVSSSSSEVYQENILLYIPISPPSGVYNVQGTFNILDGRFINCFSLSFPLICDFRTSVLSFPRGLYIGCVSDTSDFLSI